MPIFFNSWDSLIRILLSALLTYAGLILILRIAGKRSLTQLNIFDFIVTVALGSIFATTVTSQETTITDGLTATGLLLFVQYVVTHLARRFSSFQGLLKSEPTLLFQDGSFLDDAMAAAGISKEEIYAEVRQAGIACLGDVHAVVLETNGNISVLKQTDKIRQSTLVTVKNYISKNVQ